MANDHAVGTLGVADLFEPGNQSGRWRRLNNRDPAALPSGLPFGLAGVQSNDVRDRPARDLLGHGDVALRQKPPVQSVAYFDDPALMEIVEITRLSRVQS